MKQSGLVMAIAVLVLVGFAACLSFMASKATVQQEVEWNRYVYLFGGVEAIAFAAAGFLFGREVHRQQAEKADRRADEEAQHAKQATERATTAETKGRQLADWAETKAGAATGTGKYSSLGPSVVAVADEWKEFAETARRQFPRVQ